MKIVVLDGSHDKKGMTSSLIDCFVKGVLSVEPKADIRRFDLLDDRIEFCRGCEKCTKDDDPVNAKCVIDDFCEKIKKHALDCDILVFASPIYEYCISSAMKRFLERCLTLVTFRVGPSSRAKPIKGKSGVILCSSGAPFPINHLMGMIRYPKFILRLGCKLFRCSKINMIFAGGMRINDKFRKKWDNKARNLGINVAKR